MDNVDEIIYSHFITHHIDAPKRFKVISQTLHSSIMFTDDYNSLFTGFVPIFGSSFTSFQSSKSSSWNSQTSLWSWHLIGWFYTCSQSETLFTNLPVNFIVSFWTLQRTSEVWNILVKFSWNRLETRPAVLHLVNNHEPKTSDYIIIQYSTDASVINSLWN